jgi:hypothetical protein
VEWDDDGYETVCLDLFAAGGSEAAFRAAVDREGKTELDVDYVSCQEEVFGGINLASGTPDELPRLSCPGQDAADASRVRGVIWD